MVPRRLERPSTNSPAALPPPAAFASFSSPCCTVRVQSTSGDQHVVAGSPWVGEFYLLQNDNGIPDIPVKKVYPHRRPCHRSYLTCLNWRVPLPPCSLEGHPLCPWLLVGGRGFPTPSPLHFPPTMRLNLPQQIPERHLLPAIFALDPTPLPILVQRARSRHPFPVRRL